MHMTIIIIIDEHYRACLSVISTALMYVIILSCLFV